MQQMDDLEELEQLERGVSPIDLVTDQSILLDCSRYFQRLKNSSKAIRILERLLVLQQSQGNQLKSINVVLELVTLILNMLNDPSYAMKFARKYKDQEAIRKVESFLDSEHSNPVPTMDLGHHLKQISGSYNEQHNM